MKMKNWLLGSLVYGALLATTTATVISVGSGDDSSFVILDSPNIAMRTYEVFYTFDIANPLGTDDLLTIIDSADSLISFDFGDFGNPDNQFLESILFDGVDEVGGYPGDSWNQWVSGGEAGFPTPNPIPDGTWTFGSGVSAPFRIVEPGATDALIFGSDFSAPPSFNPIPEPSGLALLAVSGLLFCGRRKRAVK